MRKNALSLGVAATMFFLGQQVLGQEHTPLGNKYKATTQVTTGEIQHTFYDDVVDVPSYERRRNGILKKEGSKIEFQSLLEHFLGKIEPLVRQNPTSRKHQLELFYFDCEFADIAPPSRLKTFLELSNSLVLE